jgi:hypothetical protein
VRIARIGKQNGTRVESTRGWKNWLAAVVMDFVSDEMMNFVSDERNENETRK